VSVVIAAYNAADTLERAILSVLHQAGETVQLVVVDDGSTDTTPELLAGHTSKLLHIRTPNRGRCAARNTGARRSSGAFLAFLDADDELLPEWALEFGKMLREPSCLIACCGEELLDYRRGRDVAKINSPPRPLGPVYHGVCARFRTGTFAVRRDLFEAVGGFTEQISFSENSDLAIRLSRSLRSSAHEVLSTDRPLVRVHLTGRQTSSEAHQRERMLAAQYMASEHAEHLRRARRRSLANYQAIAGRYALRLGLGRDAIRWYTLAISSFPLRPRYYWRLLQALVTPRGETESS
jgi:glycosyltransferase involved in cell wall biosynthesis